jgi:predicted DNA binding CopG/RHH family protein
MRKLRQRPKKQIPSFRNEREEREFWETHDTTDYVDWSEGRLVRFPNLKPTTTTISLRLPAPLLADLKALANKRDVPYQSLLKVFVAERVAAEQRLQPTTARAARHRRALRAAGPGSAGRSAR